LAPLSSRFAFALAASLALDDPDEVPRSLADFWPCDLALELVDPALSLTALATAVSVVLGFELAFFA